MHIYEAQHSRDRKGCRPAAGRNTKASHSHSHAYSRNAKGRSLRKLQTYWLLRIWIFQYLWAMDGPSAWWSLDHPDHCVAPPVRQSTFELQVSASPFSPSIKTQQHTTFDKKKSKILPTCKKIVKLTFQPCQSIPTLIIHINNTTIIILLIMEYIFTLNLFVECWYSCYKPNKKYWYWLTPQKRY